MAKKAIGLLTLTLLLSMVFGGIVLAAKLYDCNQSKCRYTEKGDLVFGNRGPNKILTLGGADSVYGESGRDNLHGGDGPDNLDGGDLKDRLYGGKGNDDLDGGASDGVRDVIDCGPGIDTVFRYQGGNDLIKDNCENVY